MYVPGHFAEHRLDVIRALVEAHPLGALVRVGANGLEADHIPFELADSDDASLGVLRAHVARANSLVREDGAPVMVVFQAHSAYVSPTLYDPDAAGRLGVPTWNYAVAHAHGGLRVVDDGGWILAHMMRATARREALHGTGWKVEDAPRDAIERLVSATVGIEIVVGRWEAKRKLSQNRSAAERMRVAQATGDGT